MITLYDGLVRVTFGMVYLQGPGSDHDEYDENPDRDYDYNGLFSYAHRRGLALDAGRNDGVIRIRVELHDEPPVIEAEWEEVVETSFTFSETHLVLTGYGGDIDIYLPAVGCYRFRCSASGMDEVRAVEPPTVDDPGPDHYLLQLWPAPPQPDVILRETSEAANDQHELVRQLMAPPKQPRPSAPAAD